MLLDTSGLICLFDHDEPFHTLAHDYFAASADWLTHSYILAEFVAVANARRLDRKAALAFIPRPLARKAALAFLARVAWSSHIRTVWVDDKLHDDALRLLAARLDKPYSLCDPVSFVLMRRASLTDALTTDRHFEQEGFRRLL